MSGSAIDSAQAGKGAYRKDSNKYIGVHGYFRVETDNASADGDVTLLFLALLGGVRGALLLALSVLAPS